MDVLDQLDQADTEHIEESLDENNTEDDRSNDNPHRQNPNLQTWYVVNNC